MKKVTTVIRLILTVVLLYFIWTNSHWSVAITLTLMFVTEELKNLIDSFKMKNENIINSNLK